MCSCQPQAKAVEANVLEAINEKKMECGTKNLQYYYGWNLFILGKSITILNMM